MGACGAHADNVMAGWQGGALFVAVQHEMLLFAGVFFLIGALDEFAVDIVVAVYRCSPYAPSMRTEDTPSRCLKCSGTGCLAKSG